jgi:hypothetical protein
VEASSRRPTLGRVVRKMELLQRNKRGLCVYGFCKTFVRRYLKCLSFLKCYYSRPYRYIIAASVKMSVGSVATGLFVPF